MSITFALDIKVDTGGKELHEMRLFDSNITHNLTPMWEEAGCYEALYNFEGHEAGEIIDFLALALEDMEECPRKYEKLNLRTDVVIITELWNFSGKSL